MVVLNNLACSDPSFCAWSSCSYQTAQQVKKVRDQHDSAIVESLLLLFLSTGSRTHFSVQSSDVVQEKHLFFSATLQTLGPRYYCPSSETVAVFIHTVPFADLQPELEKWLCLCLRRMQTVGSIVWSRRMSTRARDGSAHRGIDGDELGGWGSSWMRWTPSSTVGQAPVVSLAVLSLATVNPSLLVLLIAPSARPPPCSPPAMGCSSSLSRHRYCFVEMMRDYTASWQENLAERVG